MDEFQTAPLQALTKGWGLFSSAVSIAGKEIHESVVKPGMARAGQTLGELNERAAAAAPREQAPYGERDPREIADRLSSQARTTGGWLTSLAGEGWQNLNTLAREKGGVDLSAKLGQLGLGAASSNGAGRGFPPGYEYGDVREEAYRDDTRDGWDEWDAPAQKAPGRTSGQVKEQPKTDKAWDDEWKDF